MKPVLLLVAALSSITWVCAASAQSSPDPPRSPASVPNAESVGSLVLEVAYNPALPPAYIPVAGVNAKPHWVWVTRFLRTTDSQANPDSPVRAVRFESQFNGETADVRVSLLRGVKAFDREDLVGVYHLGVAEHKIIRKLRDFGIEPIEISLLSARLVAPPGPTIVNNTQSIQVVDVKSLSTPVPGYALTLKNLSEKHLDALKVEVQSAGRGRSIALLQGEQGRPLIEAGGTYVWVVQLVRGNPTATGYHSASSDMNSLLLETAVFNDASYDGKVETACEFEGFQLGRRAWLKQVVPLLQEQLSNNNDAPDSTQKFLERFQSLKYDFSQTTASSLGSSVCPRTRDLSEIGYQGLGLEFLRDFKVFTSTKPTHAPSFQTWLETLYVTYSNWLKRL